MQSFFEIKNPLPYEVGILDELKNIALQILINTEKKQYAQAIVLLTSNNNKYCVFIENALSEEKADEDKFIDKLVSINDTEICYILCLWQDGGLDLPSFYFRKKLCEINPSNLNAGIFVLSTVGYSVIKLNVTLK